MGIKKKIFVYQFISCTNVCWNTQICM